jgi:hypothetical protein
MPDPYQGSADAIDFATRVFQATTVDASPSAATETVVAHVTVNTKGRAETQVDLSGWLAFTVGTSGTAVRARIRRAANITDITGTVKADTGALTGGVAATNLLAQDVEGVDALAATTPQIYVLTLTVTSGAAASTVSACKLRATVVNG